MGILQMVMSAVSAALGYNLKRSTRFNDDDSAYLNRTPSSAGNRKTWTFSCWVKRSRLGGTEQEIFKCTNGASIWMRLLFTTDDKLSFHENYTDLGGTTQVYRDPSAWYHIVLVFDTTQASNNVVLYVNNVQQHTWSLTQNFEGGINSTSEHVIGNYAANYSDFYLADVNFVDGLQLDATSFGETNILTGQWVPKKYTHVASPNDGTTWSNSLSGARTDGTNEKDDAFDGSLSTKAGTSTVGGTLTFTPSSAIAYSSSVKVYTHWGSACNVDVSLNGGSTVTDPGNQWTTIATGSGSITSMTFTGTTNSGEVSAIEVDGKVLLDGAGDNSFHLAMDPDEAGTTWSDSSNLTNITNGAGAFDGDLTGDYAHATGAGNSGTINFSNLTSVSTLRLYAREDSREASGKITVNSTDFDFPTTEAWVDVSSALSGGLSSITLKNGSYLTVLYAIEVDGEVLVDHTAIGHDSSGQNNDWHENNLVSTETSLPSVRFSGTSGAAAATNYLDAGTSSDFSIGSSDDFSFEAYINPSSVADTSVFSIGASTVFGYKIISGSPYLYLQTTGGILNTGTIVADKWTHVAVTRSSGTLYSFIDGVLAGSVANTGSFDAATGTGAGTFIGAANLSAASPPNYSFTGDISNVRFVKGSALYTSNFTVPATPLTNVTNTKLLCCQSDTSAIAAAVNPGSAAITSFSGFRDSTSTNQTWDNSSSSSSTSNAIGPDDIYWIDLGSNITVTNVRFKVTSSGTTNLGLGNHILYLSTSSSSTGTQTCNGGCTQSATNTINSGAAGGEAIVELHGFSTSTRYLGITNGSGAYGGTLIYSDVQVNLPILPVGTARALNSSDGAGLDLLADVPGASHDNSLNGGGNYATLNPLDKGSTVETQNGNLEIKPSTNDWKGIRGTIAVTSGKWYYEAKVEGASNFIGIATVDLDITAQNPQDSSSVMAEGSLVFCDDGKYLLDTGGSGNRVNYSSALSAGDILGVAFDLDNNTAQFYKNGTGLGSITIPSSSPLASKPVQPYIIPHYSTWTVYCNFGQYGFSSTPPTGFKALNAFSLPEPTIEDPSLYFDTKLYTGDGTTGSRSLAGLNFSPDFTWLKGRSYSTSHLLYDNVRGAGSTKSLVSNGTNTEGSASDDSTWGYLESFDSNGFSIYGGSNVNNGYVNQNNETYATWNWDAGSSNTSVSAGDLNSTAYDQSQTWSNSTTSSDGWYNSNYAADKGFNGITSGNHAATNSNGTITFAPNLTIPANSVIEIYSGSSSTAYMDVTVNGVANNSTAGGAFVQINYDNSTTLTSLTITRTGGGNSADLRGLKINGKLLVDSGVTPAVNVPSIPSTYRANPSAGFSIVTYTATNTNNVSVSHGLNTAPEMTIIKSRDSSEFWWVIHKHAHSDPWNDYTLRLNTTDALSGQYGTFNNVAPTSSVINLSNSTNPSPNYGTDDKIMYCFSEVEGYSRISSYTGNGSADGPFVWCGFRPKYILLKSVAAGDWVIMDVERDTYNIMDSALYPNDPTGESSNPRLDILSNGFKLRSTYSSTNPSDTVVFCAFAESPFKHSRAR